LQEFGKHYDTDLEYSMREAVFQGEMNTILMHNQGPNTWKMGVNRFTDMTEDEVKPYRGRTSKGGLQSSRGETIWTGVDGTLTPLDELPLNADWRTHDPPVISAVKVHLLLLLETVLPLTSFLLHTGSRVFWVWLMLRVWSDFNARKCSCYCQWNTVRALSAADCRLCTQPTILWWRWRLRRLHTCKYDCMIISIGR
jgi:hypothetical protein